MQLNDAARPLTDEELRAKMVDEAITLLNTWKEKGVPEFCLCQIFRPLETMDGWSMLAISNDIPLNVVRAYANSFLAKVEELEKRYDAEDAARPAVVA